MGSVYVIYWYLFLNFILKDFYNNFFSIFFLVFFHTIDKKFLLEYCSWRSRLLFIVSNFSVKVFTSFFSSEIFLSFCFLSASISSNFSLINFMHSLISSIYVALLIWASAVEEESSKISFIFFSPIFVNSYIKYQHNVGILSLLQKYLCHLY